MDADTFHSFLGIVSASKLNDVALTVRNWRIDLGLASIHGRAPGEEHLPWEKTCIVTAGSGLP
jgi:hypothetical protein